MGDLLCHHFRALRMISAAHTLKISDVIACQQVTQGVTDSSPEKIFVRCSSGVARRFRRQWRAIKMVIPDRYYNFEKHTYL
jgi:hypothetical protein